jgi:hypothetical protein
MLAALLCSLLLVLPQEPEKEKGPDPVKVAEASAALEAAYRTHDMKALQAALESTHSLPDPGLVKQVARCLADDRREVKLATLQALRWIDHKDALDVLHRALKEKDWGANSEIGIAHLRAIGQHADPSSIAILSRDPFTPDDAPCLRARIFALANVRTTAALEAILEIMGVSAGGAQGRRVGVVMKDVRVALILLTGVDQGLAPELWERWWRENKKGFRMASEPPLLPKELRESWDAFWGQQQYYERDRRREDRGKDPERPRSP